MDDVAMAACEALNGMEKAIKVAEKTYDLATELYYALEESAKQYCYGCGQGNEGCSTVHWVKCPVVKLLTRAKHELGLED